MASWQSQLEAVLRQIPGYDPWAQAATCGAWLDHAAALHAINWFPERLKHVEGSARGEPFILRPWQGAIVGNLFGWKRKDDAGRVVRRYRKCFIKVARGNGKTPLAAGIVLYGLFEDHEPGAQCYLAAGQREQAGYLFRNARGMVEQEAELLGAVTIYGGDQHRSLVLNADPLSFCKVIPADAAGQHGGIPHITVVDELHVQESRDLLEVFETGMTKKIRKQPLLVMITTADYDRPSVCNEVDAYAHAVRDNPGDPERPGLDPTFLPVIYELTPDDDYADESLWGRANPNLDVSVLRDALRRAVAQAKEVPAAENAVKRLHFNIKTSQDVKLIPMEQWDACADKTLSLKDFEGKPCYAGLDLSSKEDLTSLSLVFPTDEDGVAVFVFSWCPADKLKQRARKKFPYDVWYRGGWIEATPGDSIDYAAVRAKIIECDQRFQIQMLYADPHGARETMGILMEQHGFADRAAEFTQSMNNLSAPTKDLIFRVKQGKLKHDGNPVFRWAVGNLAGHFKGTIPAGQSLLDYLDKVPVMPSKQSSADKIDPVAATVNALAAKAAHPVQDSRSVYETRGILTL